jgi:hypothetical protein
MQKFNQIWKGISKEVKDEYARVAVKLNYEPMKGIKSQSFNGIQFYKEQLGIKTRVNPKVAQEMSIHKDLIGEDLLDQVKMIKNFSRKNSRTHCCPFCD